MQMVSSILIDYKDGTPSTSYAYFLIDVSCDGVAKSSYKSAVAHNITTDPASWTAESYNVDWKVACPAGTKVFSGYVKPAANGATLSVFTPFTLDSSQFGGDNTAGYCIEGSHSSDPSNIWKYDSRNGGLLKGTC